MTGTAVSKELLGGVQQADVDRANAELGVGISPLVLRKSGQPKLQRQAAQSRKTFRVSNILRFPSSTPVRLVYINTIRALLKACRNACTM